MAECLSLTPNLMVKNVTKSIEFYRDLLGFQVLVTVPSDSEPEWAMMMKDGVTIMLQKAESLKQEYDILDAEAEAKTLSLFVKVSDVEGFFNQVKDQVPVLKSPKVTFYGMKECAIKDPDNYVLTFAEEQG